MNSKVRKLYDEVCQYEDNRTLEDNIRERLDKSLKLYLDELSNADNRLQSKRVKVVYKELVK